MRRGRVSAPTRVAAIAVALVVTLPLAYLIIRAADAGAAAWWQYVFSPQTLELLLATGSLAAGVAALSMAIALPYAWLVTRTDLPGRRF